LDSYRAKLDVSDIDFSFHKYETNIDGIGERNVKLMLNTELKTNGKYPDFNQLETAFFNHQLLMQKKILFSNHLNRKVMVWHFGQYHLIIHGGVRPDACEFMEWGIFDQWGSIKYHPLTEFKLIQLWGFEVRPDNFQKIILRRHHKTQAIWQINKDCLCPMVELVRS
jgi:hypothetical protein